MKLHSHTQDSLKRRCPTVQALDKTYNELCRTMEGMIKRRTAPAGAVCPQPIPDGGLWQLDVDDAIWQDIGLVDGEGGVPPPWLCHEATREGIRHQLDYDRVVEEEARVLKERHIMQDTMQEEWAVVQQAKQDCGKYISH